MVKTFEELKKYRETQNIQISEVSVKLKIPIDYLNALENADFQSMPEKVYAIGFLRSYGKFINVDVQHLEADIKSFFQEGKKDKIVNDCNSMNFFENLSKYIKNDITFYKSQLYLFFLISIIITIMFI